MKKVILLAGCLITLAASAQESPVAKPKNVSKEDRMKTKGITPEQRAQKSVDELHQIAVLTDEQKPKIYDLALTRAKNVDAIKAKYKGDETKKDVAQKEIEETRKTYRQSAKALLTPEQLEKVKVKTKEMKATKGTIDPLESKD